MKAISTLCSFTMLLILTLGISQTLSAQADKTDEELVHDAVEDYVLALYNVEPDRIERSVHKDLRKIGYYDYNGEARNHVPMTYQQLYDLSASWNKSGERADDTSPKKIDIYYVHDRTASAKLTATWGIDFMHLCKVDGKWQIMNIMWQAVEGE